MVKPMFTRLSRIASLVAVVSIFAFVNPIAWLLSRAAASPSLATLMPSGTFSFTEIDTSDLPQMATNLQALLTSLGVHVTFATDLDQSLTQALGRPISLESDVFPWLGDRVGVGIYVPPSLIEGLFTRAPIPSGPLPYETYVLASVKDESAADAFLTNVLAALAQSGEALTSRQSTLGGILVTIYSDPKGNSIIARWPGYVAFGNPSLLRVLDVLSGQHPTLANDANYKKIVGMLKPNSLAVSYMNTPFPSGVVGVLALPGPSIGNVLQQIVSSLETPGLIPTAMPGPERIEIAQTFVGLGASGVGLYGDQRIVATDWASYVNPDNLQKLLTLLKVPATVNLTMPAPSISLHMADRIPKNAVAVAFGSNLAQITRNGLVLGQAGAALTDLLSGTTSSASGFALTYAQIQGGLKLGFGLDLDTDVLSWLNGEFALYTLADAVQPASISFTPVLLVQTTDSLKTDNFITRINAGLQDLLQLSPTKNINGLYSLALPGAISANYGRVNDTMLLTVGNDPATALGALTTAGNGLNALSADADWQAAAALAPPAFQHFWYINLTAVNALFKQMSQPAPPGEYAVAEALLSLFKSAVLYSTDLGGGSSLTTIVLVHN